MRWQNNIGQTKEKGKNLQDQINEDEIGNLPKKEFRVLIIKTTLNLKWNTNITVPTNKGRLASRLTFISVPNVLPSLV